MTTLTIGNRLDKEDTTVQSEHDRQNSITSGHRACQGCGEALAARCVIDAAYKVTNGKIAVVNATGCLEVFSCVYPENSWQVPWLHSLFGNAPAVATGVASAFRISGDNDMRVIAQGGDGATCDIGMGCLSGMFDRNDDVLYVCYDNQAYMNTGVQRSSATPIYTRTATTLPTAGYIGNAIGTGKNVPEIAMAHGIPYVATASIANIRDLEEKVIKAINTRGARYLHVHVPCPLGWGYQPSETIRVARMAVECGLFPLFEAENGILVGSTPVDNPKSVEEYLRAQRRFAHLFGKNAPADAIEALQRMASSNIEKYKLNGGF
ncbi:pyruvate synthase subunit beta [Alphaproteobacteria bacterium]|nr:pyruvate synthase subunit beta [Alphaproteobacteria bacterium]